MMDLTPEKGLIFRITHVSNVPWLLDNDLHCRNSDVRDPNYREIGNPDLIAKRVLRLVPIPPGGSLSDYVPFYFTPYSPMLLNIKTGYNGIRMVPMSEIVVLVSSLPRLVRQGVTFVFTDRHAYLQAAMFSSDLAGLERLDWQHLQARDFRRGGDDFDRIERYQAEALIHRHLTGANLGSTVYSCTFARGQA
jgi:hypothetical protein